MKQVAVHGALVAAERHSLRHCILFVITTRTRYVNFAPHIIEPPPNNR